MHLALFFLAQSLTGTWDAKVVAGGVDVPFKIGFSGDGSTVQGWFFNGDDKVRSTGGTLHDGALTLDFAQYASRLQADLKDGTLTGTYGRLGKTPYVFTAKKPDEVPNLSGNWVIPVKSPKGESAWRFVVRQTGPEVTATILRIDGDTGALTGRFQDGKLLLSHFSGARPNVIEVAPQADASLQLTQNGKTQYRAVREKDALAQGVPPPSDPFHFTTVEDAAAPFRFSFPDLNGNLVSNTDPRFRGKVIVVAISGSWCPNCHDEAPFLQSLYKQYRDQGLEVVSLSFEEEDQLKNPTRLRAFVKEYGLDFTVLVPGTPDELHTKVPQAVNLNSWPTTFFLGRDGRVRGVHAGFAGAASSDFNLAQNAEVASLLGGLLSENVRGAK